MSKGIITFNSSAFDRAREIVANEYNRITVKSNGKVVVSRSEKKGAQPTLIIKASK